MSANLHPYTIVLWIVSCFVHDIIIPYGNVTLPWVIFASTIHAVHHLKAFNKIERFLFVLPNNEDEWAFIAWKSKIHRFLSLCISLRHCWSMSVVEAACAITIKAYYTGEGEGDRNPCLWNLERHRTTLRQVSGRSGILTSDLFGYRYVIHLLTAGTIRMTSTMPYIVANLKILRKKIYELFFIILSLHLMAVRSLLRACFVMLVK